MTKAKPVFTPAQLQSKLRGEDYLSIGEAHGKLWATDKFWMIQIADSEVDPFRVMLAEFNLTPEPMVLRVARTVVRTTGEPPRMVELIDKYGKDRKPITRETFRGKPFTVEGASTTGPLTVWSHPDGATITLSAERAEFVSKMSGGTEWFGRNSNIECVSCDRNGETVGFLMPVRSMFD